MDLWPLGYIGPGPGLAVQGPALLILLGLGAAVLALVTWPVRWLFKRRKPRGKARVGRLVILGLDGLEPTLTQKWMEAGHLPSLSKLAQAGCYRELRTTTPPLSPVAWSTFSTGVNPGKHGVFDFIKREPDYRPSLSISGLDGNGKVPKFLRKSKSFWKILAEHGVSSHIVRVPVSWPPEEFDGFLLSSMGTPDLMGTQGTYTLFSAGAERELTHGDFVQLRRVETAYLGEIGGPGKESVAFEFDGASLTLHGRRHALSPGRHSPWIEVRFKSCVGLAKFLLLSEDSFYMTALQIHPGKPASSLSHPRIFSVALARLLGNFATCGLAEDLGACDDRILSLDAFLQQAYEIHEEREKQFFHCLGRTRSGVCAVVFDGTDRIQHMTRSEEHLKELYGKMDELVGRTRAELGPNDALIVLSDHGFKPLLKLIDLNAWLLENGYLFLTEDEIDWTRTKAYTLGLAGISLNLTGREKQGVVSTEEAPLLRQELARKLSALKDEDVSPIEGVYESCKIYHGPYAPNAPDLIIGYKPGYGVHKEAARGRVGTTVVVDNDNPWVADHCYHADLVPGVLFSTLDLTEEASLVDLAPTVLELFGIGPVDFHDGRSLLREAS